MMDYVESKIARREYEERVRSLTPVQDHDDRLKDDRQLSIWPILSGIAVSRDGQPSGVSKLVARMFHTLGSGLASIGQWVKQSRVNLLSPR